MTDTEKIEDLLTRGVENIISDKDTLRKLLESGKKLNCYLGIDPTATRIHVGHAFPLRKLALMAELGHNVTFLIGDFTAKVGDTSDKNDERPVLTDQQIKENFQEYKEQASKLLDFDKVNVRFNSEWLSELNFADILELTGNFSVNDFTSRELIRDRLKAGKRVSLPETLYPIMQGYDSYFMDTDIQFGGTDQTFNMQAGRTLIKRLRDKESFIIANGFLPGTDGRKMSKSWGNAIWLADEPNDIFGKIMSVQDEFIEAYFNYATNLPLPEIAKHVETLKDTATNPMDVKKVLARTIVAELCGEDAVAAAEQFFVSNTQNKDVSAEEAIHIAVPHDLLNPDGTINSETFISLLAEHGIISSKSEGRRLFEQNAIHLNEGSLSFNTNIPVDEDNVFRVGKRRYVVLEKE